LRGTECASLPLTGHYNFAKNQYRFATGFRSVQKMRITKIAARYFLTMAACTGMIAGLTGCERKEKILDIETPGGDIEVERSTDTGKVDVDINTNRK
jgi:hypothetical protein